MRRALLLACALIGLGGASRAGDMEEGLRGRWLGAWVVTTIESYSDCGGMATNNRVHGELVRGRGRYRFEAGELAQVVKVDLNRSRIDLHLALAEPLLVSSHEGPFTLYDRARCKVELEVEVPRSQVKRGAVEPLDRRLLRLLERHAREGDARASASWNAREVEPYPEDYDDTLVELAIWRANQTNAAVQAKLDLAVEETSDVGDRMTSDPDYLAGFVKGVRAAKSTDPRRCPGLLSIDLGGFRQRAARSSEAVDRGYQDGQLLVLGLELVRRLPACFVPVPAAPESWDPAEGG